MAERKIKKPLCDERRLSVLVRAWQRASPGLADEWWAVFVNETADWLFAIIRAFKADLSVLGNDYDIRAELVLHLHKVLPAYRHARGKLFSFVTKACQNYLFSLLEKHRRQARHYVSASVYASPEAAASEPEIDAIVWLEPDVYGEPAEIRERLELFTAPREDFEFWLTCNLVVYAYGRDRGRAPLPSVEQIARIVGEIVSLPPDRALIQTRAALIALQKLLSDFRGRPSLYANQASRGPRPPILERAPALEIDFSWQ